MGHYDMNSTVGPPISFLYLHLHNSIRNELGKLVICIRELESAQEGDDVYDQLVHLKERYRFLEQVYSYHSSVEDEVSMHGVGGIF